MDSMRLVTNDELSLYKILPFNLHSEHGDKIFSVGEVLTPGKLTLLQHYDKLYASNESSEMISSAPRGLKKTVMEDFDYDDLDITKYKTPINKISLIEPETQIKVKMYLDKVIDITKDFGFDRAIPKYYTLNEIILREITSNVEDVTMSSQIRFIGDYEVCHPLNVAILSSLMAKKLEFDNDAIAEIVIGAFLHDIGKTQLDENLFIKTSLSNSDIRKTQEHTKIGYSMLKRVELPETICNIALQHHENNDGTGYPIGLSGDMICVPAQIVNVCNVYDNLAFNKTPYKLKNNREVLRTLLELGTKRFSAEMLYTFIHMFSYNDTTDFEEMKL